MGLNSIRGKFHAHPDKTHLLLPCWVAPVRFVHAGPRALAKNWEIWDGIPLPSP